MSLAPGTRIGAYEIQSAIGAGGMGEVYRARDTKLGRAVAIKTLPEAFAKDPQRVARFEREAQILASLNHPHIAAIHGLEESDGTRVLVLELVEGESLAERLARSAPRGLDPSEAVAIALQIVDALEAAHEKGIIHRDLKPGNVMLSADADVKVLDFGLARMVETDADASAVNSPTLTFAATQMGVILGTAAYMSPEQAKGRTADKRSDVWALGCVLFEMLSGRRPFEGEDVSDTLAAVLRSEPDWAALPAAVPPNVHSLLRGCLAKDRKKRISDVAVLRYVLSDAAASWAPAVARERPAGKSQWTPAAVALVAGVGLTAAGASLIVGGPAPDLRPMRFAIPTAAQSVRLNPVDRNVVIAPDAKHLAYVGVTAAGLTQLMVLPLGQLEAAPLGGTAGVRWPFFSPDGRWIGFFSSGELRRVSVSGGPSIPICPVAGGARGATWLPDDTIVFATNLPGAGLWRVPAGGGEPQTISKPDTGRGETGHVFPSALPDGRGIVFTVRSKGSVAESQIAVLDLATGEHQIVIRGGSHGEYVSTGHLVYAVAGTLRAVRFDQARRQILSDPVPVEADVLTLAASGAANYSVSRDGHLVYVPGNAATVLPRSLVWVDRQGREEALDAPSRGYQSVRISPDGTRAALDILEEDNDIYVLDLSGRTPVRLTFDPASDGVPLWTPDGQRILFQSARAGPSNVFWQAADGSGDAERLTESSNLQAPQSISRDGNELVIMELVPQTRQDLLLVRRGAKTPPEPLVQSSASENNANISPDGRWLAYVSDETGTTEVYVRPFPRGPGRWQVSSGGSRPVWARSGRELFFLDGTGAMMSVTVQSGSAFTFGTPTKLFDDNGYYTSTPWRSFDVAPDGKRFLMIKEGQTTPAGRASMVVVLNWGEELKVRLPER